MKTVVQTEQVSKTFLLGKTKVQALSEITIDVFEGEFLAIAGPSGSGKTTLLNLIGCIDQPTEGLIKIDGEVVTGLSSNRLADIRMAKLSFIFQTFNLIPVLSAYENVEYPLLKTIKNKNERFDRVSASLKDVGLETYMKHRPDELSGGQRQRVAIARALVTEPRIILADEPTANLDQKTGEDVLNIMKSINEDHKTLFIFSTHDPKVMQMASRIIRITDGRIVDYNCFDRRTNQKKTFSSENLRREKGRRDFDR
ncbi:LolD2 [Desulforapulum autotrophicum HRM2]|uniref:LolD2 n=1 Tax=Desulforapulum autotrophicum (strain ATCC 43914 / DSM 3382 / VKM B-1955 / HRM2) TaxID=177437 RepID=C0QCP3_DESAH|nr:ABC transporter ATP-binding protein [Desulforapulum autotrophicum]ACN15120.1 LolD2 [Desulforapulum autotrophicum HRM2]